MIMIQPVILAAGKGTRMHSELPKVLHKLGSETLLQLLVAAVNKAGLPDPIIVVGYNAEKVKSLFTDGRYLLVEQHELSGTATAVRDVLPFCKEEKILVLYGDQPLITPMTLERFIEVAKDSSFVIGTAEVENFSDWRKGLMYYGRILREGKVITGVVEYKNASDKQKAIQEVNIGVVCADRKLLEQYLPLVSKNELSGEYYLTDLIALVHMAGITISNVTMRPQEGLGVNSPEDLAHAEQFVIKEE